MTINYHHELKNLNLFGMAAAWQEWHAETSNQNKLISPEALLERLIVAENSDRQARSLNYQLKSTFPASSRFNGVCLGRICVIEKLS